jgi:hypothetical protein
MKHRRKSARELRRLENVVLQQLEQDSMASENSPDPRAAPANENPKGLRLSTRPSPQSGPPISNEGLESPRSSHC